MASKVPSSDQLYHPIKKCQTRLLRLKGDRGLPGSQVSCMLYTVDLPHPNVEGLLLRSTARARGRLIEYDALSYAWGSGGKVSKIRCNGLPVMVTENLFEALRALRPSKNNSRFLWVDALCINQDDSSEKNEQVWNMLAIYQKARKVMAWLGTAEKKYMKLVMLATSASPRSSSPWGILDFLDAVEGVLYLYKRPWFKRLWVQQEIFAARKLEFQYGNYCFEWSQVLWEPDLLLKFPLLRPSTKVVEGPKVSRDEVRAEGIHDDQVNAMKKLYETRKQNLECFEIFAAQKTNRPDFVDTLLNTGLLIATNPRDYIYGIIGMTDYPAKPMRIQDWLTARQSAVFIPIDYAADLTSIMCAVTWVLLMKDGPSILAQFKVNTQKDDGSCGQSLPSWVIDWRISARFFERQPILGFAKSEGAFRTVNSHVQFQKDNKESKAIIPCNKLILRGTLDSRFYVKKDSVWEKRPWRPDTVAWRLKSEVHATDLIVRMNAFLTPSGKYRSGLWLLRPVGNNEFRLIACLAWASFEILPLYKDWHWNQWRCREANLAEWPVNRCRRLAVASESERYWPKNSERANKFWAPIDEDTDSANNCIYTIV